LEYRYCTKDLHQEPERYFFSETGSSSFIESFLAIRKLRIDQLIETLEEHSFTPSKLQEGSVLPLLYSSVRSLERYSFLKNSLLSETNFQINRPGDADNCLDIKNSLEKTLLNQLRGEITLEEERVLDKLARKFEISRKIFAIYDSDFKKIESSSDEMIIYALLAINLFLSFESGKNFKFLNTGLKINDMLVTQKSPDSLDYIAFFIASFSIERSSVIELCKNKNLKLSEC
jgi:hypothetical protein